MPRPMSLANALERRFHALGHADKVWAMEGSEPIQDIRSLMDSLLSRRRDPELTAEAALDWFCAHGWKPHVEEVNTCLTQVWAKPPKDVFGFLRWLYDHSGTMPEGSSGKALRSLGWTGHVSSEDLRWLITVCPQIDPPERPIDQVEVPLLHHAIELDAQNRFSSMQLKWLNQWMDVGVSPRQGHSPFPYGTTPTLMHTLAYRLAQADFKDEGFVKLLKTTWATLKRLGQDEDAPGPDGYSPLDHVKVTPFGDWLPHWSQTQAREDQLMEITPPAGVGPRHRRARA